MEPNIVFSHVTKTYKGGVTALEDVSFSVGSGVFGLLGHNGAGKSTLIKPLSPWSRPPPAPSKSAASTLSARGGRSASAWATCPKSCPCTPACP